MLFTFTSSFISPNSIPLQAGSDDGSLILIGGGSIPPKALEIFIQKIGGLDQPIIIIPTSAAPVEINLKREKNNWLNKGFTNVKVLHTNDPKIANTEKFVKPLKKAKGIWFGGGRQWRCIDAYKNTLAEKEFHNLLNRGGVIIGNSAGASVQGSFLARGAQASNIPIIAPEKEHQVGFGFLKNMSVDQHADTRNRWMQMQEIILKHPEILGISIAEHTAVLIQKNCLEVFGEGEVAIHHIDLTNGRSKKELPYKMISCGQVFNLQSKRIENCN